MSETSMETSPYRSTFAEPCLAGWSERLLAAATAGWRGELRRLAIAVALGSLFGVALGLRDGGALAIVRHAAGIAAGFAAVCGLGLPALVIALALANAAIDALGLVRATARAAAAAGLVLAGLAPSMALFALTLEDDTSVAIVTAGGLAMAGAIAMRSFVDALAPHLATTGGPGGPGRPRRLSLAALPAFLGFAALLGARIWWLTLPILRGVR